MTASYGSLPTPTAVAGAGFPSTFVCLSVCFFPCDISKTAAARITKRDAEMFRHESWKSIYFRINRSKVKVTRHKCYGVSFSLL